MMKSVKERLLRRDEIQIVQDAVWQLAADDESGLMSAS